MRPLIAGKIHQIFFLENNNKNHDNSNNNNNNSNELSYERVRYNFATRLALSLSLFLNLWPCQKLDSSDFLCRHQAQSNQRCTNSHNTFSLPLHLFHSTHLFFMSSHELTSKTLAADQLDCKRDNNCRNKHFCDEDTQSARSRSTTQAPDVVQDPAAKTIFFQKQSISGER